MAKPRARCTGLAISYVPDGELHASAGGARRGNSLGLRIPKDIAAQVGLRAGACVEIAAEGERITLTPARRRYVLSDLLEGATPETMRDAFDWGPDRGREIVARGA
ncbi:MAG: AbrB/MazE/SpoVT family DNA-binding domain-containing protein [Stellaceae bacterium]